MTAESNNSDHNRPSTFDELAKQNEWISNRGPCDVVAVEGGVDLNTNWDLI